MDTENKKKLINYPIQSLLLGRGFGSEGFGCGTFIVWIQFSVVFRGRAAEHFQNHGSEYTTFIGPPSSSF